MANKASLTLSENEVEFVQCVEEDVNQEETMDNLPMKANTQYVLEVEPAEEHREKKKGKGKGKLNQAAMKKKITNHGFVRWLKTIWLADTTLRVMKPWLKAINEEALKMKDQKLFFLGQSISQIMKFFFLHMKEAKRSLTECSFVNFEEWCCGEGLSTTFGKLQEMAWEDDLKDTLFNLYSETIMELRRREEQIDSDSEEEAQEKTQSKGYLSSPNMRNTCMSSTIVPTREVHVAASTSKDSENTLSTTLHRKRNRDGPAPRSNTLTKESSPFRKQKIVTLESESDDEVYRPGNLFNEKQNLRSVEEESEPEIEPPKKKTKKPIRPRVESSDSGEEEVLSDEGHFTSMVDSLARAHSLAPNTGKIQQSILIKDGEGFLSFTSPGERGSMILKFEMYPYKDCLRLEKNQYWTKRIFSSLAVVCSKSSPAYKTAMKLREQLTQQVGEIKGCKIEKKAQTGWKPS